jgi:putative glutamine amidotransferase
MPHSTDLEYGERAIPQYERAVTLAGGEPVRIPLDQTPASLNSLIASCSGILLPGSNADINPARFQQEKSTHAASADLRREAVDDFLLEDAYSHRKPVLCICFGLQSLNVFRGGSLVQHIPDFLPEETRAKVNHEAGRNVAVAHNVEIEASSRIASIVTPEGRGLRAEGRDWITVPVNSSHHQSADAIGDGLRIVARCPDDGIIEALEGTSADHFVLAVQWHPERSVDEDEPSREIFRALIEAANHK